MGGINYNPYETGVWRSDHHIGLQHVMVTTGTTTTVVSTVSYHLASPSSDTITSYLVPGNRFSELNPLSSTSPTVPKRAPPANVGQV